ncbi:MAG: biotin--[acetyl-CoA-carboxylase] ligase [Magnetococcales bacterium]|nr:biotin--[acetyl-CoA-carboxylase] ligase [Magnetococcales bacterium]
MSVTLEIGAVDRLTPEEVTSLLTGTLFRSDRYHHRVRVDSTSRVAMAMARDGAPEGTVVVADQQTQGRGRVDRSWYHHPDKNLAFSCILRPAIAPMQAAQLTLLAGVALAESVAALGVEGATLKWPNDLLISGRKAAGILSEMILQGQQVMAVVIGVGVNVNTDLSDFPTELRQTAISLSHAQSSGLVPLSRSRLLVSFLDYLTDWYRRLLAQGFEPVRQRWLAMASLMGQPVRVMLDHGLITAVAVDLDRDGFLLINHPDRGLFRVVSGDLIAV